MQTFDTEKTLQQYHQRKAEREAENLKIEQQQTEEKAKTTKIKKIIFSVLFNILKSCFHWEILGNFAIY